jgi:ABC-type Fe3+-hydroxamate transport system substrate-binding protein
MSICLVLCAVFALGACGSSGSASSTTAPAAAVASTPPTTPAATVATSPPTTVAPLASSEASTVWDPTVLVGLLMTTYKVNNRPCVEKAVSEFPEDVLKIVQSITKNGNPSDNWPDNRALALVHIVQACPNSP